MAYPARADQSAFTPGPHFRPAKPDTPLDISGRTISRNKGMKNKPKDTLEKFPTLR